MSSSVSRSRQKNGISSQPSSVSGKQKSNTKSNASTTPAFSFPSTTSANSLQLNKLITIPLTDQSSTYASVTKICLHISQYTAMMCDGNSFILHERSFIRNSSRILSSLMKCVKEHRDRRCRIVASKCLATFAKTHYKKLGAVAGYMEMCGSAEMDYYTADIANSTNLSDESAEDVYICTNRSSLEDECSSSTAICLADCALNSQDEGVVSAAVESLTMLCCDDYSDEISKELSSIIGYTSKSHRIGHSLDIVGELEEMYDPVSDLRRQVLTSISTRIRQLFRTVNLLQTGIFRLRCIPFLAISLVFYLKRSQQSIMNDAWILSYDVAQSIFLEGMTIQYDPRLRQACAIAAIRLLNYNFYLTQSSSLCQAACEALLQDIPSFKTKASEIYNSKSHSDKDVAQKSINLALLFIGLKGLEIKERAPFLIRALSIIRRMPNSTENDVVGNSAHIPLRFNLLSEYCFRIMCDKWVPNMNCDERLELLVSIFNQKDLIDIFDCAGDKRPGNDGLLFASEVIVVFCSCASLAWSNIIKPLKEKGNKGGEGWVRCVYFLLDTFVPFLGWTVANEFEDRDSLLHHGIIFATNCFIALLSQSLVVLGIALPPKSNSGQTLHRKKSVLMSPSSKTATITMSSFEWGVTNFNGMCSDLFCFAKEGKLSLEVKARLLIVLASNCAQHSINQNTNGNEVLNYQISRELLKEIGDVFRRLVSKRGDNDFEHTSMCSNCVQSIEAIILSSLVRGKTSMFKESIDLTDDLRDLTFLAIELLNGIETKVLLEIDLELLTEYNLLLERLNALIQESLPALNEQCLHTTEESLSPSSTSFLEPNGKKIHALRDNLPVPTVLFDNGRADNNRSQLLKGIVDTQTSNFWNLSRSRIEYMLSKSIITSLSCCSIPAAVGGQHGSELIRQEDVTKKLPINLHLLWAESVIRMSGCSEPLSVVAGYHTCRGGLVVVFKIFNDSPVPIRNGCRLVLNAKRSQTTSDLQPSYFRTSPSLCPKYATKNACFRGRIDSGDVIMWKTFFEGCCDETITFDFKLTIRDSREDNCHYVTKPVVSSSGLEIEGSKVEEMTSDAEVVDNEDVVVMSPFGDFCEMLADDEDEALDQEIMYTNQLYVSPLAFLSRCPNIFRWSQCQRSEAAIFSRIWAGFEWSISLRLKYLCKEIAAPLRLNFGHARLALDQGKETETTAWAFQAFSGKFIYCLSRENSIKVLTDSKKCCIELFVRSNDIQIIFSILGTPNLRQEFLRHLFPGKTVDYSSISLSKIERKLQ